MKYYTTYYIYIILHMKIVIVLFSPPTVSTLITQQLLVKGLMNVYVMGMFKHRHTVRDRQSLVLQLITHTVELHNNLKNYLFMDKRGVTNFATMRFIL